MANIRVYELARKLGKDNKEVLAALGKLGIEAKSPSSSIDAGMAEKAADLFKKPQKAPAKPPAPVARGKSQAEAAKPPAPVARGKSQAEAAKPPAPVARGKSQAEAAKPPAPVARGKSQAEAKKGPAFTPKAQKKVLPPPVIEAKDTAMLPEEETVLGVPERFRKDIEADKEEKFKVRPTMQKAFQAIRKIDHAKRPSPGFKKKGRERHHQRQEKQSLVTAPRKKTFRVQDGMTVREFADLIGVKLPDIMKKFMELGYAPTINQVVDMDAALMVSEGMGVKLEVAPHEDFSVLEEAPEDLSKLSPRPPIVTIMGHVDHGKTSLLDAIRETKVMATEAGGITQHIGAYKVSLKEKEIVFLDTPGHEAFTALRARGAKVTDIVVLVVAADDGVKPQTVEAIDHAKAAGVPIIVAINKIDKPEANIKKVKTELAEHGIMAEDWGGQNIFAEISAKQRMGIDEILELILLQAEMMELKANPHRLAKGVIIEARLDKGRGPVATLLVQAGEIKIGDVFISGVNTGRVKAIYSDLGRKMKSAGPSTPVELIGFSAVPSAGDTFAAMEDEKKARQIAMARVNKLKSATVGKKRKLTLEELYSKIKEGDIKDLNIVIKGDVQGSVEAIRDALEGIKHPEVKVKVIHSAVGGINESDVMLASASNAIVIGFNVRPEIKAAHAADKEGVDIELYNVIYEAIDDVKKALEGLLEPTIKEKVLGRVEVRQTFVASKLGTIAGCMVIDGRVNRNCDGVRVIRDSIVVYEGRLGSLKRFKEDVKEVQSGYECGIMVENFNDIKVGDIVEDFVLEKIAPTIS